VIEGTDVAIAQALSSCQTGRGQTVLLGGPPGRGTSYRLAQAAEFAHGLGMHVAWAAGRPAERTLGFSVAVELFEPVWRAASWSRSELRRGPADAAVRLFEGGPALVGGDGGYAITRGIWTLARRLAQQPPAPAGGPHQSGATGPRGLAIVVDDLHDVDGPTLGVLAYVADRLASSPITILAGGRIDVASCAPAAYAAIMRAARVQVPELLDATRGAAFVDRLLPSASPPFARACVTACGGNAALLAALLAGLAAAGESGSEAEVDRVGAALPDGVAALVAERLSRMREPMRALLRAVAASEGPVALEQAAASAGLGVDVAFEAFDALVRADVLLAEPPPTFAQPIVRAAVRASLTPGQRMRHATPDEDAARASRGLDALTPSEGRVAGLAARGMTTRQIAGALFVTPKTVEFHLRNVYAKLEIPSSRAALARALDPVASHVSR